LTYLCLAGNKHTKPRLSLFKFFSDFPDAIIGSCKAQSPCMYRIYLTALVGCGHYAACLYENVDSCSPGVPAGNGLTPSRQ